MADTAGWGRRGTPAAIHSRFSGAVVAARTGDEPSLEGRSTSIDMAVNSYDVPRGDFLPQAPTSSATARRGSVTAGRGRGPTPASSGIDRGRPAPVKLTVVAFIFINVKNLQSCLPHNRRRSVDNVQVPLTIAESMTAAHPRGARDRPGARLCSACRAFLFPPPAQNLPLAGRRGGSAAGRRPGWRDGPPLAESSPGMPPRVALSAPPSRLWEGSDRGLCRQNFIAI